MGDEKEVVPRRVKSLDRASRLLLSHIPEEEKNTTADYDDENQTTSASTHGQGSINDTTPPGRHAAGTRRRVRNPRVPPRRPEARHGTHPAPVPASVRML